MPGDESNYNDIVCPFCDADISRIGPSQNDYETYSLGNGQSDFFQCGDCDKFFRISLEVYESYDYIVETPTEEEIQKYKLFSNNPDLIIDVPGQSFMWEDLFEKKI